MLKKDNKRGFSATCRSGLSSGFSSCICSSSFCTSSPSSTPSSGSMAKLSAAESVEPRENTWPCAAQGQVEGWWVGGTRAEHTPAWRRLMQRGCVQSAALLKRQERIPSHVESALEPFSLLCPCGITVSSGFSNHTLLGLMHCAKPPLMKQLTLPVLTWRVHARQIPERVNQNRRKTTQHRKNTQGLSSWFVLVFL